MNIIHLAKLSKHTESTHRVDFSDSTEPVHRQHLTQCVQTPQQLTQMCVENKSNLRMSEQICQPRVCWLVVFFPSMCATPTPLRWTCLDPKLSSFRTRLVNEAHMLTIEHLIYDRACVLFSSVYCCSSSAVFLCTLLNMNKLRISRVCVCFVNQFTFVVSWIWLRYIYHNTFANLIESKISHRKVKYIVYRPRMNIT